MIRPMQVATMTEMVDSNRDVISRTLQSLKGKIGEMSYAIIHASPQ